LANDIWILHHPGAPHHRVNSNRSRDKDREWGMESKGCDGGNLQESIRCSAARQLHHGDCFDEAIQRAEELDVYFAKEGKTIGPLHGLPISLKDQFNIKGLDTTIGYMSRVNKPASNDSTLVTLLLNAGAILYVKTNVPATLMRGETVNNVFGTTCNPRNRKLTSGGSSGGESALVSFREASLA